MFMMPCNNKGCGKYQAPTLSTNDNEVYCSECGNKIIGVSHFTKIQLKTLGQTKKSPKTAYSLRCDKCKQEGMPKLDASNNFVCGNCANPLKNVSAPFAILIRKAIEKGEQDL